MSRYRKAGVAVAGALAQAVAAGVVPEAWLPWAQVALAVATALGVWAAPNTQLEEARTR